MKFLIRGSRLFQYFIFDDERVASKIFDKRFSIHDLFEKKVNEMSLCVIKKEKYIFVERIDSDDRVAMVSEVVGEQEELTNYYFVLAGFTPKSANCLTCAYNIKKERTFINCSLKNKTITTALKSCSVYKEMEGLFKT